MLPSPDPITYTPDPVIIFCVSIQAEQIITHNRAKACEFLSFHIQIPIAPFISRSCGVSDLMSALIYLFIKTVLMVIYPCIVTPKSAALW